MDLDQSASVAGRELARRRWGPMPAEKARRRRADLLRELLRLERLEAEAGEEEKTEEEGN